MQLKVKATNISLSPEISEYLDKRLRTVEKFVSDYQETTLIEAELGKTTAHHQTGNIFRAEINLSIEGKLFRAAQEASDLYSAIDAVKDEIIETLRGFKDKKSSLAKRTGQRLKYFLRKFYK
jgi:ribosomal subunit interface protein